LELKKKLKEEIQEYIEAKNDHEAVEELADVLEILNALLKIHNTSFEQVERIRREKADKNGAFEEKVYLVDVED
jgi:predicted house-cleaning noncanonical NTP pyrophosphatase (MazG superfamily)